MSMGCCKHELLTCAPRPNYCALRSTKASRKSWQLPSSLSTSRQTILSASTSSVNCPQALSRAQLDASGDDAAGLGIVESLRGKNFLITGGSGFLVKVLVEKILRAQPDVGQIFLLLRAEDKDSLEERLSKEIINCDLFDTLKDLHGKDFEGFLKSKISLIMGDISIENLGIDFDTIKRIKNQVHVIVNSAATTRLNERHDVALSANTRGVQNVIQFSKMITSLQLIMHVSTAYVNGHKEGLVNECPLTLEEIIPESKNMTDQMDNFDIEKEHRIVEDLKLELLATSDKSLALQMKDFGMERAARFGFDNTYVFTKALGELVINEASNDIPIVIVRPTMISSTIMEPFKGWIEGFRVLDPILLSYAKGRMHGIVGESSTITDMIPVDMVINAMLAMITKHVSSKRGSLEVYHVSSSSQNPLSLGELMDFTFQYFSQTPYKKSSKVNPFIFHPDISSFMEHESQHLKHEGHEESSIRRKEKLLKYIKWMVEIYKPYNFIKCRFDCSRTMKLYHDLSHNEKKSFFFGVEDISWGHFIKDVHIVGLKRHVLKDLGI